ncbi:TPA: hypothetical protein JAN58_09665 [Legionella pneumophila]|nr:hypothetical protein [Legionella pneumophila]HAT6919655.1 hypothetical protein [Legionella pneumophila]HAT6972295.1 hypothetical protein [Legionella pneumophila]
MNYINIIHQDFLKSPISLLKMFLIRSFSLSKPLIKNIFCLNLGGKLYA